MKSDGFFDLEDSHRASNLHVRRFKRLVRNHPKFDALARSEAVPDLIRQLLDVSKLDDFSLDMVREEAILTPRLTKLPVCIPLPSPLLNGPIYERQSILENNYFEVYGDTLEERND
jgi:hypothetical protein